MAPLGNWRPDRGLVWKLEAKRMLTPEELAAEGNGWAWCLAHNLAVVALDMCGLSHVREIGGSP